MALFNSSSVSSFSSLVKRGGKQRRWPLSPYKGKWQQKFDEQRAMETLMREAANFEQQQNPDKPLLLSALINSFNIYGCEPTPYAYSFIIKTLAKNFWFDQLPPVLDRLEKVESFEPPENFFVDLIRIYGKANMFQDAVDIFFRIPKFRCTLSVHSLNALLLVLCKKSVGLQMVHQILLKSHAINIRLEESSFHILITTLCKIKRIGNAIELLNHMPRCGYNADVTLYSLILSSMCEHGEFSSLEVTDFLGEMQKTGFTLNAGDFVNVIKVLVKDGRGMDALDVLDQMKSDGIKPDIVCYTMVLDGIISAGDFQKADDLFDEILVMGLVPDLYSFNVYINGLCKQNNVEAGFKMVGLMEQFGCKPDVVTYNTLIGMVCKIGQVRRAQDLIKEMGLKGVQGNLHTYTILIDGLVSKDQVMEALMLLEEMWSWGFIPQSLTFDEIVCGLCKKGLVSEALKLLEQMVSRDATPGTRVWEALLLSLGFKTSLLESTSTILEDLMWNSLWLPFGLGYY
ncbi:pentatricopeptide repeat-containing protein At2g38420, mitochondrial [Telopea speciosissima]|uniref:pentatricopeptide repeat-containing protein At2g38420, mitochondrial n=1 Tax=Telopea speciosissima TaxID=54955 RepID=UPI001CC7CF2F|nr:pentatricopeptide repeat-containing protein At2g38420, mitochondrial [Telopea speciosissima]